MIATPKQVGFTLIELIITTALISILAMLALPSYRVWVQNNQTRNAAESILAGIQVARAEAVSRNASVQLDLRGTHSAWTVCASAAMPGSCPNPDNATTVQSRDLSEGSSTHVDVVSSDAGPFVFNGLGVMTSPVAGAASGLVSIDVGNTEGDRDLRVVIGIGGSSKMCDPALPSGGTDPRRCP